MNIPNELLQTSRNLVAYVFVDNHTVQKFIFEVNSRPKPAGYVYTESEILKWNSLDDRIKALEESGGGVEGNHFVEIHEADAFRHDHILIKHSPELESFNYLHIVLLNSASHTRRTMRGREPQNRTLRA